jgi:hypothetical protein
MAQYYEELLHLCGFEDSEIKDEKPRIERALKKLELGPEDMDRAVVWVRKNHEVELFGMRRILRAWLLELFDLVLAREEGKKIVYYGFPSIEGPGIAIKTAAGDGLYCACPDAVLCHTLGQIFNKLTPILEAGERNGLPPGHGLCSLQQVRVGGMAKGITPVPDLVTGSSYFCDMGSKADELLHEKYGHRAIYVDGSMDARWGTFPKYPLERVEYFGKQLNKLFATVKEVVGVEVNHEVWKKAITDGVNLVKAISQLQQYMNVDPMPISSAAVELAMMLSAASTGRARSEGPEAITALSQDVKQRVEKGVGVVEKGAPRVMTFLPSFSDPTIAHMIEEAGLAVLTSPMSLRPPLDKPTPFPTLGEEIADRQLKTGYHSSFGMVKSIENGVRALNVDGLIWNYLYNCRPLALSSHFLKKWVEENTGIPTLALEMDIYDSRSYSAGTMRTKVEAFAEMLRAKKYEKGR